MVGFLGASTRSGPVIATTAEIASQKSTDSQKTVSFSGLSGTSGSNSTSTDSERTYRVDSQDSQMSDTEAAGERHWPRQNSVIDSRHRYYLYRFPNFLPLVNKVNLLIN